MLLEGVVRPMVSDSEAAVAGGHRHVDDHIIIRMKLTLQVKRRRRIFRVSPHLHLPDLAVGNEPKVVVVGVFNQATDEGLRFVQGAGKRGQRR